MSSPLKQNTVIIETLLETINNLPEAGTDLPTLTNEGSASDLLSGKELINSESEVVTGTIATKTASDLTASGATVTVPAGYYASAATKSVATATQATPSVSVNSSGLITASATQTAGYVAAGTKSGTKQLTTQAAKTITPSTSSQTAVEAYRYTTGDVTVAPIPSNYEDIGTETTDYTTKIAALEAELDAMNSELEGKAAGGSGGASVETCTVTINTDYPSVNTSSVFHNLIFTTFTNNNISFYDGGIPFSENTYSVVKNTLLLILPSEGYTFTVSGEVYDDFIGNDFAVFYIGGNGEITIT